MPCNFCGTGTKFYGQEETGQADAYIATEWLVFCHIPILPIGSFRVCLKEKLNNTMLPETTSLETASPETTSQGVGLSDAERDHPTRVPLQWQHICNVYAALAAVAILVHLFTNRRTALLNLTSVIAGKPAVPVEVDSVPSGSLTPITSPNTGLTEPVPDLIEPALVPTEPVYKRPATAENGAPFPESSGYIEGFEQAFTNGKTILTVDHTKNHYDIYVKLYNLDVEPPAWQASF